MKGGDKKEKYHKEEDTKEGKRSKKRNKGTKNENDGEKKEK